MVHAQHHVGIHLDEAAITVIGEAGVAGQPGQAFGGRSVQAQIEHRIHHAGHGDAGAGPHREQQRLFRIAEIALGGIADFAQRQRHLFLQVGGIAFAIGIVPGADLGGDGQARGHRQPQVGHLRQVGALAAQQVSHAGFALGLAVAECIDPFRHLLSLQSWRSPQPGAAWRAGKPAGSAGSRAPAYRLHSP